MIPKHLTSWLLFMLFFVAPAHALDSVIRDLSAPDLKKMLEEETVTLVNVLSEIEYEIQHIPNSINVPIIQMDTTKKLPAEKNKPLIFHCLSDRWHYGLRAARIAVQKGHSRVYSYSGGIPEWRSLGYPLTQNDKYRQIRVKKIAPQKLSRMLAAKEEYFVLDVRPLGLKSLQLHKDQFHLSKAAIGGPYIEGMIYCPMVYLEEFYHEIPSDRPIIITDWIMKQSTFAAKFLSSKGYHVVGVLKGGMKRWVAEGLPTEELHSVVADESILCD